MTDAPMRKIRGIPLQCGHCAYWLPVPAFGTNMGQCHKMPPTPLLLGMTQVMPAVVVRDQAPQQAPVVQSYFPPMPAEGAVAWCGLWEPKAQGEA
jgi:hypothetical protein